MTDVDVDSTVTLAADEPVAGNDGRMGAVGSGDSGSMAVFAAGFMTDGRSATNGAVGSAR